MFVSARLLDHLWSRIALGATLALAVSCTIVKQDSPAGSDQTPAQKAAANEEFDAKGFVKANWTGKVEPEVKTKAVNIREIVGALKKDKAAAAQKYGLRKDETALYNFVVKGKEKIKSVNTESAAGFIELDLADLSGEENVKVQIGPVIKSSALRDVLSFINFGDFTNQLEFANISKEMNFYVRDNVVSGIQKKNLVGKHLTFAGAFAEDSTGRVFVTPVTISVEE